MDAAGVANLDVSGDFFAPESVLTNIQDQLIAAGIRSGVDTVVTGADFSESLKSNLRFAGAAVIGAQLSQEIGIEFAKGEIAGAFAAAIAGGDESDVNLGAEAGANAAENNALVTIAVATIIGVTALLGGYVGTVTVSENALRLATGEEIVIDDPVRQALGDMGEGAINIAYDQAPETTEQVFGVLESIGDAGNAVIIYADEVTGQTVSSTWNDLSPETKVRIKAGGTLVGFVAVPAVAAKINRAVPSAKTVNTDQIQAELQYKKLAEFSGILRDASKNKGNFGLGKASQSDALELGKAWVGKNYKVASDGKTLISENGLRQFRPPSYKPRLGSTQANFEWRLQNEGAWQGNGHLDIVE